MEGNLATNETKKSGGIFEAIGKELFSDTSGSKPPKTKPPRPSKRNGTGSGAGSMLPSSPAVSPMPIPAQISPQLDISFASSPSVGAQAASDNAALEDMKAQVFIEKLAGRQSTYLLFLRMWEALKRPSDVEQVLNALKVSYPNLTKEEVLGDLQQHAALLEQVRSHMAGQVDEFARTSQADTETQISELRRKNDEATAEITRHQNEIGQRNTQIGNLQTGKAEAETKISRARGRQLQSDRAWLGLATKRN